MFKRKKVYDLTTPRLEARKVLAMQAVQYAHMAEVMAASAECEGLTGEQALRAWADTVRQMQFTA
jgi:hypothetical protein